MISPILKLNTGRVRGLVPHFELGEVIPKTFYQTHSEAVLDELITKNRDYLQSLNPGWQYEFFDADRRRQFIEGYYGRRILGYYDAISDVYGASKADLFRYLLMYKMGGVYLDVKSSARLPFDDMIRPDDRYLLAGWDSNDEATKGWGQHPELAVAGTQEYQQWHIIAANGHPYLKDVIERVLYNIDSYIPSLHGTGAYGVYRVTGPIVYSLAIAEMAGKGQHRLVASHADLGLIYSIYPTIKAHRRTTGSHYSDQKTPITKLDLKRRLIDAGFRAARACYRRIPGSLLQVLHTKTR